MMAFIVGAVVGAVVVAVVPKALSFVQAKIAAGRAVIGKIEGK